jgi:hypothetical protein
LEVTLWLFCRVKTVKEIKTKLPTLRTELNNGNNYRDMYKGVYSIFLIQSTSLDVEYAIALWNGLLNGRFNYLNDLL